MKLLKSTVLLLILCGFSGCATVAGIPTAQKRAKTIEEQKNKESIGAQVVAQRMAEEEAEEKRLAEQKAQEEAEEKRLEAQETPQETEARLLAKQKAEDAAELKLQQKRQKAINYLVAKKKEEEEAKLKLLLAHYIGANRLFGIYSLGYFSGTLIKANHSYYNYHHRPLGYSKKIYVEETTSRISKTVYGFDLEDSSNGIDDSYCDLNF